MGREWSKAVGIIFNKKYKGKGTLKDAMKDPDTRALHEELKSGKKMPKANKKTKKMRGGKVCGKDGEADKIVDEDAECPEGFEEKADHSKDPEDGDDDGDAGEGEGEDEKKEKEEDAVAGEGEGEGEGEKKEEDAVEGEGEGKKEGGKKRRRSKKVKGGFPATKRVHKTKTSSKTKSGKKTGGKKKSLKRRR